MNTDTLIKMLLGAWDYLAATSLWICVWGFLGRLAGHTRGRGIAGAWLGLLFGPIGVLLAWRLKPQQAENISIQPTSGEIKQRITLKKQRHQQRPETEMERFERLYHAGQRKAESRSNS